MKTKSYLDFKLFVDKYFNGLTMMKHIHIPDYIVFVKNNELIFEMYNISDNFIYITYYKKISELNFNDYIEICNFMFKKLFNIDIHSYNEKYLLHDDFFYNFYINRFIKCNNE